MLLRNIVLVLNCSSVFATAIARIETPQQPQHDSPAIRVLGSITTVTSVTTVTSTFTRNVYPTCIAYPNVLPPCPQLRNGRDLDAELVQPSAVQSVEITAMPAEDDGTRSEPGAAAPIVPAGSPQLLSSQSDVGEYEIIGLSPDMLSGQAKNFYPTRPFISILRVVNTTITRSTTVTRTLPVINNAIVRLTILGCLPVNPPLPFPQCPVIA